MHFSEKQKYRLMPGYDTLGLRYLHFTKIQYLRPLFFRTDTNLKNIFKNQNKKKYKVDLNWFYKRKLFIDSNISEQCIQV